MSWRWPRGGCLICITISWGDAFAEGEGLVFDLDFLLPVWGRRERSAEGMVNRPWMACLVPSQHGCCVGTALP